jgi:hypothetical protein
MNCPEMLEPNTPRKHAKEHKAMATRREPVVLDGRLIGMGRDAECTVSAVKVTLVEASESFYTKCSVHKAPDDMPEGRDHLTYGNESARVRKRDGFWLEA